MQGKGNLHQWLVGLQTSTMTLEISVKKTLELHPPCSTTLCHILKGHYILLLASDIQCFSFTTAKKWDQPKCLLTDEWKMKMFVHTMEYSSTVK